jgi:hypothetical protein
MRDLFRRDGGYFQVKTLILLVVEIYCYTTTLLYVANKQSFFFQVSKATVLATDSVRTRNHHLNVSAEKGKPFLIRITIR